MASLSGWKQKIILFAGALGAPGLFLISFLDSSILTFPVINDLLLIQLSIQNPARMPLYASLAALGSVLGCVLLYFIAAKGGEAFFRKKAGERGETIRLWVQKNGFGGILLAALLPPPTPFKIFVFAAGVFDQPVTSFAAAIAVARLFRYFGIGYLTVKYGADALPYVSAHKLQVAAIVVVLVAISYALSRLLIKPDSKNVAT